MPSFSLPRTHAILSQLFGSVFSEIRVAAALRDRQMWYPIHVVSHIVGIEIQHGVEEKRYAYNERCIARARRTGEMVEGQHAGLHDLFAPISDGKGSWGYLVTGPFATELPTSDAILSRFLELTGGRGSASDPGFLRYVSMTLATATFLPKEAEAFRRIVKALAALLSGAPDVDGLAREVQDMREELSRVRLPERMWEATRALVDEQPAEGFMNEWRAREKQLQAMGMRRVPKQVLVGFMREDDDADPVGNLVRRDSFQRASAASAARRGGALCAPIGERGVVYLVERSRAGGEIGERARTLARLFGITLHLGASGTADNTALAARYEAALAAAERALAERTAVAHAKSAETRSPGALLELRRDLARAARESPHLIAARFDRYFEAAALRHGYRLEPLRAHLEASLDLVRDVLRSASAFDERSHLILEEELERATRTASTVRDLSIAYRNAISQIEIGLRGRAEARRERSLRRAIDYVRARFSERLTLGKVARVAGFAPGYFSKLFARSQGVTLHAYLRKLRVERAKLLLTSTAFDARRIGEISGLGTRCRFHVVFRQSVGMTPREYRAKNPLARAYLEGG